MGDLHLSVILADKTRHGEITVSDTQTFGEIIEAAIKNWALCTGEDINNKIAIVSRAPPETFSNPTTLATAGIMEGEILQIRP